MKRASILLAVMALLFPAILRAQFYVTGDNPGNLKWNTIETDNFSIIYPQGSDSLARVYGYNLEKFRIPVSRTTGYTGGGPGRLRMPVVMHAYNTSNGSVAWAPKRMDLFTVPSAYDPEPLPWPVMLSVHEGRHVTQMQFGMTRAQKPIGWFFGEMWNILASLLYPGLSNMEGDAVIAETALTRSGRGRTADFLNYYHVAFDNGDFRRWDQWRLGSQKRYAPDHYALGYMTVGGFRYLYDCPDFMSEGYHLAARRPYNIGAFHTTTRKLTGKKFNEAFMEVCHMMHGMWKAEAEARAPFMPAEAVTAEPRLYADYCGTAVLGDRLYAIKKGHETVPVLVGIDSLGREKQISKFAYQTSGLQAAPAFGRLYWSETTQDARWSMKADSRIRFRNVSSGGKRNLTGKSLIFNPGLSGDNTMAAVVQYHPEGGSSLKVISSVSGEEMFTEAAPDSLQLVETAWIEDDVYATAISDGGFGIYRFRDGEWSAVLRPQPVKVKDFRSHRDQLTFTCDRTGVNELYHLDPATGELRQKTVTRYGAEDFAYSEDGKWLYFSSQTMKGKRIFRTATADLPDREADFTQVREWPLAEKLASQEKAAALAEGSMEAVPEVSPDISGPKKYGKLGHMFNVHSWAPLYVNVDNIMNMSYDYMWQAASLGATGIMQNRLGTGVGEFGYSAHKDPYNPAKWRHSGHARFTYSGLYPVIEATVDFNDRAARQWSPTFYITDAGTSIGLKSTELNTPYIEGRVSMYIPFNFSSGGWFKGVVPRISYRISNDKFNTAAAVLGLQDAVANDEFGNTLTTKWYHFIGSVNGENRFRHSLSGSIRAYTTMSTPNSAVYPRWGIGVEAGASGNIESSSYLSPMGYGYAYGYVPGIMRTHGIKLTAMVQTKLGNAPFGQAAVNIMPRGLADNGALLSWLSTRYTNMTRFTADYAFPVFIGDLAIGGNIFSIKRLVVNPHFDITFVDGSNLFSAGAELILDMHSILTLEWPCSFGVTYSYNSGSGFYRFMEDSGYPVGRHYVGPTFNVTF